jgi:hypothetical protein
MFFWLITAAAVFPCSLHCMIFHQSYDL